MTSGHRGSGGVCAACVLAIVGMLTGLVPAGSTEAAPDQLRWSELSAITPLSVPALATLGKDTLHAVTIAHQGYVAHATSRRPQTWSEWQIIGPAPGSSQPPFFAASGTAPVLVAAAGELYLFVRGADDNLYATQPNDSAGWWKKLSSGADVKGRISVATTTGSAGGDLEFHVLFSTEAPGPLGGTIPAVRYRRYDTNLRQTAESPLNTGGGEGVVASDGFGELFAAVRAPTGLLLYRDAKPWGGGWRDVTAQSVFPSTLLPATDTVSNAVHYAGSFHLLYSTRRRRRELPLPTEPERSLHHARLRASDDEFRLQRVAATPQASSEFQATLAVHRNKLVAAYGDAAGDRVRAAYWDSADPQTPWIVSGVIAAGRTRSRPALATIDAGLPSSSRYYDSASDSFGRDLVAVVVGASTNRLWSINLSRTFVAQRLIDMGLTVNYVLDDPRPSLAAYDGRIYVFQLDRGRRIRYIMTGGNLRGLRIWRDLGGDFGASTRQQSPALLVFNDQLYVFTLHWDGNLYSRVSSGGDLWSSQSPTQLWTLVGSSNGASAGPLAAVFRDKIHLLTIGGQRVRRRISDDGTRWTADENLPALPSPCESHAMPCHQFDPTFSMGALVVHGGRLHLFVRVLRLPSAGKYEPSVWHLESDGAGSWSGAQWEDLELPTPSSPNAGVVGGRLVVVARDLWDGVQANRRGATWEGWRAISGSAGLSTAAPSVVNFDGELHVVARGADYRLRLARSRDGGSFTPWTDWSLKAGDVYGPFTPDVRQIPAYSELGAALWSLPAWMMNHIWKSLVAQTPVTDHQACAETLRRRAGGHLGDAYLAAVGAGRYPIWVNFNSADRRWCGAHYRYERASLSNLMHELGHTLSTALGIHDGNGTGAGLESRIPPGAQAEAAKLFGQGCPPASEHVAGRPRGFVNTYSCTSRQHDFIELLREYLRSGSTVRRWIGDDAVQGATDKDRSLLMKKYRWIRTYIFGGIEYTQDAAPVPGL